jgi:Na+/melibiose symporter-like transporter
VLERACQGTNGVIATGGGAVMNAANREMMMKSGVVICLAFPVPSIESITTSDVSSEFFRLMSSLSVLLSIMVIFLFFYPIKIRVISTLGTQIDLYNRTPIGQIPRSYKTISTILPGANKYQNMTSNKIIF